MTGSSGGELTAWEIMQKMDGGHGDEVVAILSGGSTDPVVEERGTFEVVLPASSMNLPDGGWVQLEIEEGDMHYKETAFAGPDGNVYFTAPRLRIGAFITVTLTAFTPDGNPYRVGSKTSLVEEGGTTSFTVPLADLNNPTVTYTDAMLTDEAAEGGYRIVRYSWLNDKTPKFSVTNPYDDGSATMTVELDGTTLTGDATTGNISNQPLSDGQHTINITLSNPAWRSDITVEKKIKVKMKAVKVSVSTIDWWFCSDGDGQARANQEFYIKAENADGEDARQKTCYTVSSQYGTDLGGSNSKLVLSPRSSLNYVYLTAPASTFKFYTNRSSITGLSYEISMILEGNDNTTRTLDTLKSLGVTGTNLNTGDLGWSGGSSSAGAHGNYTITISWEDKAYTAGTDD